MLFDVCMSASNKSACICSPDYVHEEEALVVHIAQQVVLAALERLLGQQQHIQGLPVSLLHPSSFDE